jgi:hypothetical protein
MDRLSFHDRRFIIATFLFIVLCVSVGLGVYQSLQGHGGAAPDSGVKTFVFYWLPGAQDIINGTLSINVTVSWNEENLTLSVTVNDKHYKYPWQGGVGLVFGSYKNNSARWPIAWNWNRTMDFLSDGYIYVYPKVDMNEETGDFHYARVSPDPSQFHKCRYEGGIGYIYDISLPREIIGNCTVMHLRYAGLNFETEGVERWVAVNFEGWR